jgi:AAHS family 4-hydroxybenzoate transporter-like MFS transporter
VHIECKIQIGRKRPRAAAALKNKPWEGRMANGTTVDVARVIDESPLSGLQIFVIVVAFIASMLDGFDTQAISFAGPGIAAQWKLAPAQLGTIFSVALFGTMIGVFGMGLFQDRVGRRMALLLSVLIFGILTVATAFTWSFESLVTVRFLAGIGLGAALPNFLAYVAEYSPARLRARLVTLTVCGFPFGAVVGGAIASPIVPVYGWQPVFWAGGVLPLLLLPLIFFALPETIRFLTLRPGNGPELASILNRINPALRADPQSVFVLNEPKVANAPFIELFQSRYLAGTILLPLGLFASLLLTFCLLSWLPILLRQAGLGPAQGFWAVVVLNASGIVGSLVMTYLIDKGSRSLLIMGGAYLIGAASVAAIGVVGTSATPIMTMIALAGIFVIGPQIALSMFIANFYPTAMRGTGIGWGQAMGRFGSVVGPYVGAALVAYGLPPANLFQVISLAAVATALCLLILLFGFNSTAATVGATAA